MALKYPSERILAQLVNQKLVAYEKSNIHLFSKTVLSTEEQERRMAEAKSVLHKASEITQFAKFAKSVNKARRILHAERQEEERPAVGEKVKKLIDILRYKVMYEIKELEKSNYEAARDYVQGVNRIFTLETSTYELTEAMNRDSHFKTRGIGSFTGKKGYYAALTKLKFVHRKYNKSAEDGRITPKGTIVCLDIELDWVFGFSFFLANFSEDSATKENTLSNNLTENIRLSGVPENSHSGLSRNKGFEQANFPKQSIEAIIIANQFDAKREARQQDTYVSCSREVINCARRAVKLLLDLIYTNDNFAQNKIRTNKETALKAMPQGNDSFILSLMTENINELLKEGKNLGDIEDEISATIEAKKLYMERHENKYVYPPVLFLDPNTKGGLLWILRKRRETPKEAFQKIEKVESVGEKASEAPTLPTPSVAAKNSVQNVARHSNISWFISEGAYEYAVRARVKKWGKDAVSAAIALGCAKIARGFDPKSGTIPYIMGIIDRIESIEQVERDAAEQIALWKNKIPFGTPKPKDSKKEVKKQVNYTATAIIEIALRNKKRITSDRAAQWAERLSGKENAETLLASWIDNIK